MRDVKVTKDLENKTLTIERSFNAPAANLWRAYADKEWFERWWGPEGWETTVKEFDFRAGGRVHYCMKCIDPNQTDWYGQESCGLMEIQTVDENGVFTYTDYFTDEQGTKNQEMPVLRITNKFVEAAGITTLVSTAIAESAGQIEQLLKMGMVEGFSSQFGKLDMLLAA